MAGRLTDSVELGHRVAEAREVAVTLLYLPLGYEVEQVVSDLLHFQYVPIGVKRGEVLRAVFVLGGVDLAAAQEVALARDVVHLVILVAAEFP